MLKNSVVLLIALVAVGPGEDSNAQDALQFHAWTIVEKGNNEETSRSYLRVYGRDIPYSKGFDIDLGRNSIDVKSKEFPFVVELGQLGEIEWAKSQSNELSSVAESYFDQVKKAASVFLDGRQIPLSDAELNEFKSSISKLTIEARRKAFAVLLPHQIDQIASLEFAKRLEVGTVFALKSLAELFGKHLNEDMLAKVKKEELNYRKELKSLEQDFQLEIENIRKEYQKKILSSLDDKQKELVDDLFDK